MLSGMENSILGVWVAHGEGRFTFKNNDILNKVKENNCLAIRYTDDYGNPTEQYPLNPNGSTGKNSSLNAMVLNHFSRFQVKNHYLNELINE